MVKRRNLLHFNNGARSERDLGDLVTKVFEKAAKKEPQPLYTFSLPLLSVQDDIRVYCKKKYQNRVRYAVYGNNLFC